MKRIVHYKQGYKIVVNDKFYELSNGNRAIYFGVLRHKPTLQEVWNKTIGLEQEKRVAEIRRKTRINNEMDYSKDCHRLHCGSSAYDLHIIL